MGIGFSFRDIYIGYNENPYERNTMKLFKSLLKAFAILWISALAMLLLFLCMSMLLVSTLGS